LKKRQSGDIRKKSDRIHRETGPTKKLDEKEGGRNDRTATTGKKGKSRPPAKRGGSKWLVGVLKTGVVTDRESPGAKATQSRQKKPWGRERRRRDRGTDVDESI